MLNAYLFKITRRQVCLTGAYGWAPGDIFTPLSYTEHFIYTSMSILFFFWAEYLLSTFLTQIWDAPLLPQTKGENIHFKGRLRFSFALTHCSLRPMKEEFIQLW